MIEVVASMARGPVFLAGEVLECLITFTNPMSHLSTSASSEMLAWASAQIHCQFHASESRVALPAQGTKQDVQAESDTVLIPSRGERGQCVLDTPPKILFCDLRLDPGESKTYSYSEVVPTDGPPSFRGQAVKYVYKLTIGCQRVNSPIKLLRVPFRVLVLHVTLRWRLHFEFVTAREPVEAPVVLQNQSEVTVWTGAEHVDVDTFSWDLPIKVLPTNPTLASYVSQFTGTNSINI
ncbi:RAB6A-GEF complex partner 2-like isoform X2 [Labeo rohita]|uniref:RAB6A-GEF complex partner 2-like isoform X2 n=1 Tax=Labeo rohita TaxID=84645 RepID=A0A498MY72_LABRO|nr:RAB6A-GEF complex partner 2-like isoform X2 [Labeo rohita]